MADAQRTHRSPIYRAYRLDHEGCTLGSVIVIEAGDDEYATGQAQKLANEAGVELWHGKRLVSRINPAEDAAIG